MGGGPGQGGGNISLQRLPFPGRGGARTPKSAPQQGPRQCMRELRERECPGQGLLPWLTPSGPLGGRTPLPQKPPQVLGSFSASVEKALGHGPARLPAPREPPHPGHPRSSTGPAPALLQESQAVVAAVTTMLCPRSLRPCQRSVPSLKGMVSPRPGDAVPAQPHRPQK